MASLYSDTPPPILLEEHVHEQWQVSFHLDPAVAIVSRRSPDGSLREQRLTGRQICFVAPGVPHAFNWEVTAGFVSVYFEPAFLAGQPEAAVAALLARESLTAAPEDAVLWLLANTLRTLSAERPDPDLRLLETVMLALGRRLVTRHGRHVLRSNNGARLSPGRLRIVLDYIYANLARHFHVPELAKLVSLSAAHFTEVFGNATGLPPMEYVREARFIKAHDMALSCEYHFNEIADACGFSDGSHLNREFKKFFGYPARRLRYRWTAAHGSENA